MHSNSATGIGSFYPPQLTLMGPGPSEIHPRVFSAMGRPTIGYLDPVFVNRMDELKALLRHGVVLPSVRGPEDSGTGELEPSSPE